MTDAIRELFELLTKKEKSGSDYTGTVTRVDGKTAYVQFDGSDITDTPVALSIGAKAGDSVRVRVADGRAWLVGNDDAPPNDSSEVGYELALTNALIRQLTTEQINGENGWINLLLGTFNYGNALIWNGSQLTVSGTLTAGAGSKIGGWDIGSSTIYSGTKGANTALVTLTSGNDSSITIESNTSTATLGRAGITFRNNSDPNRIYSGIAWNGIATSLHDNDGNHEAVLYPTYLRVGYPSSTNKTFIREGTGTFSGNVSAATFTEGGTSLAQKYMGMEDANGYWGLKPNGSNAVYVRTTQNGLIPYQSGGSGTLGASSWPFNTIYGKTIYENGTALSSKYAASGHNHSGTYLPMSGGTLTGTLACKTTDGTSGRYVICSGDDTHRIGRIWLNSTTRLYIHGCANSTTYATYSAEVAASDIRLKTNIDDVEIKSALAVIDRIRLHAFDWKDTNAHQRIGVIADELEALDPMLADGGGTDESGNMLVKTVNTFYLQGYEVKAIQELHAEVKSLKAEIAELKEIIAVLMEGKK